MASNWPTSIDNFGHVTGTESTNHPNDAGLTHADIHNLLSDAITKLETNLQSYTPSSPGGSFNLATALDGFNDPQQVSITSSTGGIFLNSGSGLGLYPNGTAVLNSTTGSLQMTNTGGVTLNDNSTYGIILEEDGSGGLGIFASHGGIGIYTGGVSFSPQNSGITINSGNDTVDLRSNLGVGIYSGPTAYDAGIFTSSVSPQGTVNASGIGDLCISAAGPQLYLSTGAGTNNWTAINSSNLIGETLNTTGNTTLGYGAFGITSVGSTDTNTGIDNVAIGYEVMFISSTPSYDVAIGYQALYNDSGGSNVAVGYSALKSNTSGTHNIGIGYNALLNASTPNYNIGIGYQALSNITTGGLIISIGSNNTINDNSYSSTAIGDNISLTNSPNSIALGTDASGAIAYYGAGTSFSTNGIQISYNARSLAIGLWASIASQNSDASMSDNAVIGAQATILSGYSSTAPTPSATTLVGNYIFGQTGTLQVLGTTNQASQNYLLGPQTYASIGKNSGTQPANAQMSSNVLLGITPNIIVQNDGITANNNYLIGDSPLILATTASAVIKSNILIGYSPSISNTTGTVQNSYALGSGSLTASYTMAIGEDHNSQGPNANVQDLIAIGTINNAVAFGVDATSGFGGWGGGAGMMLYLNDAGATPNSGPSSGGYMFSAGGALYWHGSNGTVTLIANA